MSVREAAAADLAAIGQIEQESFGDSWSLALLAAELDHTGRIVLVDDQLRGYATAAVVGDTADLMRIAVVPSARRQGVAGALFADVRQRLVVAGVARLLLEVADDNHAARALYERLGFAAIDRRPRYYPDGADAIVMELALDPAIG